MNLKAFKSIYFFALLVILVSACRREEPTVWDIQVASPLAEGRITWSDLIADSLRETDENGVMHLIYQSDFFDVDMDTLIRLDDTTIVNSFTPGFNGGPLNVPAGFSLIELEENITLGISNAEIREVRINAGTLRYTLTSYVEGPLSVAYHLPGVLFPDGTNLQLLAETEAGSIEIPYTLQGEEDLSGVSIDLQGVNGSSFNRIASMLNVAISSSAGGTVPVYGNDSVTVELTFEDVVISYGRGYFGNQETTVETLVDFSPFIASVGSIELEELSLSAAITNTLGADLRITIDEFSGLANGTSTTLSHELIGQPINLTRALDNGNGSLEVSSFEVVIDESNSNIATLVGSIPSEIAVNASVDLNPLGDISGGNDFIYTDQAFEASLALDIPLCLSSAGLWLQDSLSIAPFQSELNVEPTLTFIITNGFPLAVEALDATFHSILGESFQLVTNMNIASGNYFSIDALTPSEQQHVQVLSHNNLELMRQGGYIELTMALSSYNGEIVKMNGNEYIDLQLLLNGAIELSYE